MKSKSLYSTYNPGIFIKGVVLKAACIGAIVYLIIHFKENPVLIGIFITLVLIFFCISGTEYIVVYTDRFEIKSDALREISKISKVKISFSYQEIEGVSGAPAPKTEEVVTYALLKTFTRLRNTEGRKLYIQLKSGQELIYWIDIYSHDLTKAISVINSQLSKKPAWPINVLQGHY